MGLLTEGTPLDWSQSSPYRSRVRRDGVEQFLAVFNSAKHFSNHGLKWGDEVEYTLLKFDNKSVKLSLRAPQLLEILQQDEHKQPAGSSVPVLWRPEYARWMIEGTPGVPYRCYAADLALVERNMALRRTEIANLLNHDECVLTLTAFPRLGVADFTSPTQIPFGPISRSLLTSDFVISPHPRFGTLTKNIRRRRTEKVDITLPLFVDKDTVIDQPLVPEYKKHRELLEQARRRYKSDGDDTGYMSIEKALRQRVGPVIKMDSTAFGMGCSCLQVTLQARNMRESRYLYDQLAVMAPLMLAMTAATPAVRGLLADSDVRWDIISAAMDDRTPAERDTQSIPKSRYSSISCFISDRVEYDANSYNDLPLPLSDDAYNRLINGGVDNLLAQHIAHLFCREPLVIYEEKVDQDNEISTDHFENIQSTNWNTVRFKPPPPGTNIGWRTEFRSMEVCLTDFENAAFSVFIVLLSRVILAFDLNFYAPMSLVDENMRIAHKRGAALKGLFHFRKNVFSGSKGSPFLDDYGHIHNASLVGGHSAMQSIDAFCTETVDNSHARMSLDEVFNGKTLCRNGRPSGFEFPGLIPLIRGYLESIKIDEYTKGRLWTYLDFVSERAAGKLCTTAEYLRRFIMNHSDYRNDSVVSERITRDLIEHCRQITTGQVEAPELLGRFHYDRIPTGMETREGMMRRMQEKLDGSKDGLLLGSSTPLHVLDNTIEALARRTPNGTCSDC